jgi:hypothetical protein
MPADFAPGRARFAEIRPQPGAAALTPAWSVDARATMLDWRRPVICGCLGQPAASRPIR